MIRQLLILVSLCSSQFLWAQENDLKVVCVFENKLLVLEQKITLGEDTIQFDKIAFLLSDFYFIREGKVIDSLSKKYHYLNLEDSSSLKISGKRSNNLAFDQLRFTFGIDSLTHSLGVLGEDLDPMHGMYWAWHSGYIFLKIEGKAKSCPARNNKFQFHIGGYQHPFTAFGTVELPFSNSQTIELHIDQIIDFSKLNSNYQLMSPSEKACQIALKIQNSFNFTDAH